MVANSNCFHSIPLNKLRVFLSDAPVGLVNIEDDGIPTSSLSSSYQLHWAEEEMNQLRCTWILYVFLQFGLQGVQWQTTHKWESDGQLMNRREVRPCEISHQEVEGQLQFLQTIDELCFRGGLGSQGQHALCKQTMQQWPHARSRVTKQDAGFTLWPGFTKLTTDIQWK